MMSSAAYKSNQFLWLGVKLLIVILGCFFLYHQVFERQIEFSVFDSFLTYFDIFSVKNILFLSILSFFNWFFEVFKWKILTKSIRKNTWFQSTRESLASLSFSLITPNRIGEYGARAFFYPKEHLKRILLLTFLQHFYQLTATILFGLVGCFLLFDSLQTQFNTPNIYKIMIIAFVFLGLLISFPKVRIYFQKVLKAIKSLGFKVQVKVFELSLIRYLIFSHQFYFLLTLFGVDISYWDAMASISSMYIISSAIPMLSLFDVAVKGSVAVLIFSIFGIPASLIILLTTIMWLLNFVIPTLIGKYFLLTAKRVDG